VFAADSPVAAFTCFLGLAVLVPPVFSLGETLLEAASCAIARQGARHNHTAASAQAAANVPPRIAAERVCPKVEALKTSEPAFPSPKTKPNWAGIVIIAYCRRQCQFRLGSGQVTEVSQAGRWFHPGATNLAGAPGTPHPGRSSGWTLPWRDPLHCLRAVCSLPGLRRRDSDSRLRQRIRASRPSRSRLCLPACPAGRPSPASAC